MHVRTNNKPSANDVPQKKPNFSWENLNRSLLAGQRHEIRIACATGRDAGVEDGGMGLA